MGSKLERVALTLAHRGFFGRRSKACNEINIERNHLRKKFDSKILRRIEAEVWKSSLSRLERRMTVQRLGMDCGVIIITKREVGIAKVF
jgi:hypothetical protein